MKVICGISALLLGTTLLAGVAVADQNDHDGRFAHSEHSDMHGAPQSGVHFEGRGRFNNNPNFSRNHMRGFRGANEMRWNHVVGFHDRNVAHFSVQDRAMWTHGNWRHERYHGRYGWWWNTNGAWFFYDQPVYPYPGYASDFYYSDDYADNGDGGYANPGYGPEPGDSGGYWYYCNNPAGYYPYVKSCRGPWRAVTPTPQDQGYGPGSDNGPQYNDDRGPPRGQQFADPRGNDGPPPGYEDDDDRGPPPGYGGDRGQPPGYDRGPGPDNGQDDDDDDGGPPPPPRL